jgi:hypothetical protein
MENLLQTVRELKTKAKNRRDLERYENAATFVNKAIQILQPALNDTTSTDLKSQIALELVDCYGLLGGINRRWALSSTDSQERLLRLQASFDAYDRGYREYEACEDYKITNSYNQLNRLVSYLLVNPSSLSDAPSNLSEGETLSLKKALEQAGESIRQQLTLGRRGDIWALADLALVNLLLDRENPAAAYANFIMASPPDYAYDSVLSVLRSLASLRLSISAKLVEAIQLLEAELQKIRAR